MNTDSQPQASRLEYSLEWFFDHVLVRVVQALFYMLIALPGLVALLIALTKELGPGLGSSSAWFVFNRLDSGMQLGLGSFIVRSGSLVLALLVLLLGVRIPRPARALWWMTVLFHGIALVSALLSSHPFEALLTVLDVAMLNVVVLLACVSLPAEWLPRCIVVSGFVVACISLDIYMQDAGTSAAGSRLTGTFHQPNMTAAYVACCLPWLFNQELPDRREWWGVMKQWLCAVAAAALVATLALTQTRAAWAAVLVCLGCRWWLGVRLRHHVLRWRFVLEAGAFTALCVLLLFVAALYTIWALLLLLILLAVAARSSGLERRAVALAFAATLVGLLAAHQLRGLSQTSAVALEKTRVQDLAEAKDISLLSRVQFWRAAVLMGIDHPLLGVGPRGFHRYYPSFQSDERWFSKFAHSALISVWAELGLLGSLVLLGVFFIILRTWWQGLQDPDAGRRQRILDALTCWAILSLCALVDVQWQFPLLPITWAGWLGYSLSQIWHDAEPPAAAPKPVSAWTLRPQVLVTYVLVSVLGVLLFLNMLWTFADYHHEVAELALQRGRIADANVLSRRAVDLNPFQGSYFHQLGLAQMASRSSKPDSVSPAELMRTAQRAVQLDSHRAVHWDLLAKAHLAAGHIPQAQEAIRRALECDPVNYPSFYTALAESYPVPQNRSERMGILVACMHRFPPIALGSMFSFRSEDVQRQLVSVYLHLADLSNVAKHPQQALAFYDRLLKIQPDEPNARLGRIVCLINLNRLKQAHKESLELYRTHPEDTVLEVIKNLYYWEGIPLDPATFGPKAREGQPSSASTRRSGNGPGTGPSPVRR
jgi:tetratricopeptide (TPR) repeat protein